MKKHILLFEWSVLIASWAPIATHASQGLVPSQSFAQLGSGAGTQTITVGLTWDWESAPAWTPPEQRTWSGYTAIALGRWSVKRDGNRYDTIVTQIEVAPTLRYWPGAHRIWFCEASIGANLLAPIYRTGTRRFSTVFNFGDHIGIGWRGTNPQWEWVLRLEHFSNAGIREPNPGQNFVQLRIAMPL